MNITGGLFTFIYSYYVGIRYGEPPHTQQMVASCTVVKELSHPGPQNISDVWSQRPSSSSLCHSLLTLVTAVILRIISSANFYMFLH
jgi:hypothetical protein